MSTVSLAPAPPAHGYTPDGEPYVSMLRAPLVDGVKTCHEITQDICSPMEGAPRVSWYMGFFLSVVALGAGFILVVHQIWTGIGTWGVNTSVFWAFDITNFVFWIGIGHAGTLISAILFLLRQRWRTGVNRAAEAMTIFAVMCAGIFPFIHMGRPWFFYWVLPLPNTLGPLWVNFRSALVWDVFAISTYFTVSLLFWYLGLIPDLATVRDRARHPLRKKIYTLLSFGWNGSGRAWVRYEKLYLLLAGLATPLVLSVHSVVSFDFATSLIPGWHTTIFPPYFVAGAIFSGFAMVLTLMIVARKTMGFEAYITVGHLDVMCKVILLTSGIVALAYGTEIFLSWYSVNPFERFIALNRLMGPYSALYITMVICNVFIPQLFWFRSFRTTPWVIFLISLAINLGMWLERFVIIVVSLHRDFLTSSWTMYVPTYVEVGTLIGSFGLFFTCFFLFCRFLPIIAMAEIKGVRAYAQLGKDA